MRVDKSGTLQVRHLPAANHSGQTRQAGQQGMTAHQIATLPRNFGGLNRPQLRMRASPPGGEILSPTAGTAGISHLASGSASFDNSLQLLQNGLPSPPEPPSFQVSALVRPRSDAVNFRLSLRILLSSLSSFFAQTP